jgi:anti-sigma regulatory factor (Ser/Thr protein kinase)
VTSGGAQRSTPPVAGGTRSGGQPDARRATIEDGFDLRLSVPADPASLRVVRHAIGGIATALGLDPAGVADVRLALTEVCSTAIQRTEGRGALAVACDIVGAALRVTVRDDGGPTDAGAPGDALPLPLVAALTETVELRRLKAPLGPGTEVTMTFRFDRA